MMNGLTSVIDNVVKWAKQPFVEDMDAIHWALFTGLIVVAAASWAFVLHDLKGEL